jgi:hypothetical protein
MNVGNKKLDMLLLMVLVLLFWLWACQQGWCKMKVTSQK